MKNEIITPEMINKLIEEKKKLMTKKYHFELTANDTKRLSELNILIYIKNKKMKGQQCIN